MRNSCWNPYPFPVKFASCHRKIYGVKHVSSKLVEHGKAALENKKLVGAVLMDFSQSFYYIPRDLLMEKTRT